ncbi:15357_t:CDS:2 [Funneliformis geosporum]|nr:15357_t:CDS:2 [Funneliformis geosporum]
MSGSKKEKIPINKNKQISVDSDLASDSIPYLAHLFDKAKKTNQKEKLFWYYYSKKFEKKGITIALESNIITYRVDAIGSLTNAEIQNIINLYTAECQKVISIKNSSRSCDLLAESNKFESKKSPDIKKSTPLTSQTSD